jgi:glycerol-1-phosphate dehydrogenase [NAD(P)+]
MSMAGTSSPASGGEHLVSHTLDMMSMLDGVPHDLHGRQVGVATILGAAIYQELMALETPVFRDSSTPTAAAFWGRFAAAVEPYHARKRAKTAEAAAILRRDPARWDTIRQRLGPGLRSPQKIKDVLRRAGAAHRLDDIGVTRERFLNAFTHAHEFRDRITILDLARIAGLMPGRAAELVDKWVAA